MAQRFTAWCKRPDWTPIITVFADDEAAAKEQVTSQLVSHRSGPHRQQYFREWQASGEVTLLLTTRPQGAKNDDKAKQEASKRVIGA